MQRGICWKSKSNQRPNLQNQFLWAVYQEVKNPKLWHVWSAHFGNSSVVLLRYSIYTNVKSQIYKSNVFIVLVLVNEKFMKFISGNIYFWEICFLIHRKPSAKFRTYFLLLLLLLLSYHSNFCSLFLFFLPFPPLSLICCLVLTCPNLPKLVQISLFSWEWKKT